jgi:hypothetical protein
VLVVRLRATTNQKSITLEKLRIERWSMLQVGEIHPKDEARVWLSIHWLLETCSCWAFWGRKLPAVVSVAFWRNVDLFLVCWLQDLGRKLVNEIKQLIDSGGQQGADFVQFALGEDRNDVSLGFGVWVKFAPGEDKPI